VIIYPGGSVEEGREDLSMARRRRRKGEKPRIVNLGKVIELLHENVSETLCEEVWNETRVKERRRSWVLFALIWFWNEVILRGPPSVSQQLESWRGVEMPEAPSCAMGKTRASFFKRCKELSWKFFANFFRRFAGRLAALARPVFHLDQIALLGRFSDVLIVDGSRLDPISRSLGILRRTRATVLPGAIAAVYDPFRGILRGLDFSADAAEYELHRVERLLEGIQPGSLVIGDRLYAYPAFIEKARAKQIDVLSRPNDAVDLTTVDRLSVGGHEGGTLEDYLVKAGGKNGTPEVTLRWILWRKGREKREVVTSVLDPEKLSAEEALALYPLRWSVEEMFYVLKKVMNLRKFHTANPNGVAMEVYACAIVYTAMRVAQGQIAEDHGIAGEDISTAKLFPRLREVSLKGAGFCVGGRYVARRYRRIDPTLPKIEPDLKDAPFMKIPLDRILVERRKGIRKRRGRNPNGKWKSLRHIPGALRALKLQN
jgi:hypothetical protein